MKKSLLKMKKTALLVFFMAGLMLVSSFLSVFAYPVAKANILGDNVVPVPAEGKNTESLISQIDDPAFDTTKYMDPDKVYGTQKATDGDREVTVMVVADDRSLMKKFNESAYKDYDNISSYIVSLSGQAFASDLLKKQNELKSRLSSLYDIEFNYSFTTLFNGFSATVKYSDIAAIEAMPNVSRVVISEKYAAPEVSSYDLMAEGNAVENTVEIYDTGIFDATPSGYTGRGLGMTVAVIDTGVDYTHPAFDPQVFLSDLNSSEKEKLALTEEKLEQMFADGLQLVAGNYPVYKEDEEGNRTYEVLPGNTEGLTARDVYKNEKIPFGYDYADHDPDCFPINDHGTHVSGIIAGEPRDKTIIGVAPKAQILALKVFPDADDGSESEDILAAVEDCVRLGVDVINMSLGRDSGFAREADSEFTNYVYEGVEEAGITLICAASNSYSSGFNSTYGSNLLTNPDSGTVGSPSTYHAAMSVASISGQKSNYLYANGTTAIYFNNPVDNNGKEKKFLTEYYKNYILNPNELANFDDEETKFEFDDDIDYVVIPGVGYSTSYIGIDVKGKVALIQRGTSSFEEKVKQAQTFGAKAAIIYNNVAGNISMVVGNDKLIPSCSITMEMGKALVDAANANNAQGLGNGGTLHLDTEYQAGPFMSQFSSWGPSPDLELKPEITGHGGDIYSSIIGGGYDHMSGTSMASPNLAGVATLLRQHIKENLNYYFPETNGNLDKTALQKVRALVHQLLMSTATPALTEVGDPVSPRKQGAGLANLTAALKTETYIYVKDGDTVADKTKLSLGDDPTKEGVYELEFYIKNYSEKTKEYKFNPIVMTESYNIDLRTVAEKAYLIKDSDIKFESDAGITYDAADGKVTVAPNADTRVKVTVTLGSETRKYLDDYFANGMYVEGFIRFEPIGNDDRNYALNIPYLAFYGDWTKAPLYDLDFKAVYSDKFDSLIPDDEKTKAAVQPLTLIGKRTVDGEDYLSSMGEYLYLLPEPEGSYSAPTYHDDYVSLSLDPGGIHDFYLIGGFLRNLKEMEVTITHAVTGELMGTHTFYNGSKAGVGSIGGILTEDVFDVTRFISATGKRFEEGNRYTFSLKCKLDYEGGENVPMNTYSFDFVIDSTPPTLQDYQFRVEYKPKNDDPYRYYLDLYVYDNNYPQGYQLQYYDKNHKSYVSTVGRYMVPINAEKNSLTKVTVEVTDFWEKIKESDYTVYFTTVDYAMNDMTYFFNLVPDLESKDYGVYNNITSIKLADASLAPESTDDKPILKDQIKVYESYDLFAKYALDVKSRWHDDYKAFGDKCVAAGLAKVDDKGVYTFEKEVVLSNWLSVERAAWLEDYKFESSDEKKFIVSEDGVITALPAAATSTDPVYITVSSRTDPSVKYKFQVRCSSAAETDTYNGKTEISIKEVKLSDSYMQLPVGAAYEVSAEILPVSAATDKRLKWIITNAKYANFVNKNGDKIYVDKDGKEINRQQWGNYYIVSTDNSGNKTYYDASGNQISEVDLGRYRGGEMSLIPEMYGSSVYVTGVAEGNTKVRATVQTWIKDDSRSEGGYWKDDIYGKDCSLIIPEEFTVQYEILNEYNGAERDLVIPDDLGIKTIGPSVFFRNNTLETVVIPEGVETIDSAAFAYCPNLRKVTLPTTIKEIKDWAFASLVEWNDDGTGSIVSSLTTVEIKRDRQGKSLLRYVGKRAFINCYQLASIDLSTVAVIDDYAFLQCSYLGIDNINTGAFHAIDLTGVKSIGDYAFAYCQLMMDVRFGADTIIGDYAFTSCQYLAYGTNGKLTIPCTHIGQYAFSDCQIINTNGQVFSNLRQVEFTGQKVMIGDEAFSNNPLLTSITYNNGATVTRIGERAFANCPLLSRINLPKGLKELGDRAFENCTNVSQLVLDNLDDISVLNGNAFAGCRRLTSIVANGSNVFDYDSSTRILYSTKDSSRDTIALALVGATLPENKIPDSVTRIEKYAFQNSTLTTVDLNNVEYLGEGAFSNSSTLKTVTLNNKITNIPNYLFSDCTALTTVTLNGAKLDSVGRFAFSNCEDLVTVDIDDAETIGDSAFSGATSLTTVTSSGKLSAIGNRAFEYCESLEKIDVSKVEIIGAYAFDGCTVFNPESLVATEIGAYAFRNAEALKLTTLPETVSIGAYAFSGSGIENITLPVATYIGDYAFGINYDYSNEDESQTQLDKVSNLTTISMPKAVYIGDGAFSGSKLTTVDIPASAIYVGKRAFANSEITEFTVNADNKMFVADSDALYRIVSEGYELLSYPTKKADTSFNVKANTIRIENAAFVNNKSLTSIDLPEELMYIGNYAFYGCDNLKTYNFHSYRAPVLEFDFTIVENEVISGYIDETEEHADSSAIETFDHNYVWFYNFGDILDYNLDNVESTDRTFTYPSNGTNYTDYLYSRFFLLAKSTATDEIVKNEVTNDLIKRIRDELVPKNITDNNVAENAVLVRELYAIYSGIDSTQKNLMPTDIKKAIEDAYQCAVRQHVDKVYYKVEFFGADVAPQEVADGGHVRQPADPPAKGNYVFEGWYANENFKGNKFNFNSFVHSDLKLYAKFVDQDGNVQGGEQQTPEESKSGCGCGTIGVGGNFNGFFGGGLLLLTLAGVTLLLRRRKASSK